MATHEGLWQIVQKLPSDFEPYGGRNRNTDAALEGFESMNGEEFRYYLDMKTGKVLTLFSDFPDYSELSDQIEDDPERYLEIEPLDSHESFRIMEGFAVSLQDSSTAKSRLLDGLTRAKPLRRFKDVVHSELALRDQWFAFRDRAHERYARDWLNANGIEPEFDLPRSEKQD